MRVVKGNGVVRQVSRARPPRNSYYMGDEKKMGDFSPRFADATPTEEVLHVGREEDKVL